MRNLVTLTVVVVLTMCASCTDLGSFSTGPGECYRGTIVDASFVRAGFETGTTLSLTLNTDALADGRGEAGLLWTSDALFNVGTLNQMEQVAHDSLSLFQFPGGRIRNYLVHVMASDGAPAMVIISLMEDEKVEVRIMRPKSVSAPPKEDCEEIAYSGLFGVFSLQLDDQCILPDVDSTQDPVSRAL